MFNIPTDPFPSPRTMHPNEIGAMYWQMRNSGQLYMGQLGGPPISIEDWRKRELARSDDARNR